MHHPKHNLCPLDKHVVEWCLTRLTSVQRKDGTLEFEHKMGQNTAPTDFKAWFLHENRLLADTDIFFGHWSTLSNTTQPHVYPMDKGCAIATSLPLL
jgi:bis(5'-nucleosyl)-tetraphosphatase (symmetrical)